MAKATARSGLISHGRVAENRRARHEYAIEDTLEAGLVLTGPEVKSLRHGRANISEAYAGPDRGSITLFNAYIAPYEQARAGVQESRRPRRLLLNRREVNRLLGAVGREGMTLIPLALYFNERGLAKLQLGLAKGRKMHDKREVEKKRDWQRDKARIMREKG